MSALGGYFPNLPYRPPAPLVPRIVEPPPPAPPATWAKELVLQVCGRIAAEHGLTLEVLLSRLRYPHVVRARDHALAVVRWSTGLSLPEIGRIFAMDHTSVLTAVRRHERELNP